MLEQFERESQSNRQTRPIRVKSQIWQYPVAFSRWVTAVRKWRVVEEWEYELPDGTTAVIPKNFKFDGASIPRMFWAILSPTGLLLIPGLIHDYSYKYNTLLTRNPDGSLENYAKMSGRREWDQLFREVAIGVNGFLFIFYAAWLALYLFGCFAWKKHRKAEAWRRERTRAHTLRKKALLNKS